MSEFVEKSTGNFVEEIKTIIGQARAKAVRSVEFHRVEIFNCERIAFAIELDTVQDVDTNRECL